MKEWKNAELVELSLSETEHNWIGIYRDGGYIGDGEISGHLSWCKPAPECPNGSGNTGDVVTPVNPANRLS